MSPEQLIDAIRQEFHARAGVHGRVYEERDAAGVRASGGEGVAALGADGAGRRLMESLMEPCSLTRDGAWCLTHYCYSSTCQKIRQAEEAVADAAAAKTTDTRTPPPAGTAICDCCGQAVQTTTVLKYHRDERGTWCRGTGRSIRTSPPAGGAHGQ